MGYILVLSGLRLAAWHCDEYTGLALNNLDIVYYETLVKCNGYVRLELALGVNLADADIRDLHTDAPSGSVLLSGRHSHTPGLGCEQPPQAFNSRQLPIIRIMRHLSNLDTKTLVLFFEIDRVNTH